MTKRYSIESLNNQKNAWQKIHDSSSFENAMFIAKDWERDVKARIAKGLIHYSIGVRIVKRGDQGEPLYLTTWGLNVDTLDPKLVEPMRCTCNDPEERDAMMNCPVHGIERAGQGRVRPEWRMRRSKWALGIYGCHLVGRGGVPAVAAEIASWDAEPEEQMKKTKEAMNKCIHCGKSIVEHEVSSYYSDIFYCYTSRAGSPIQRFTRANSTSRTSSDGVAVRAAQVRAIRFAAIAVIDGRAVLRDLADRIERGELAVPEES